MAFKTSDNVKNCGSPILWGVLIGVTLLLVFIFVIPKASEWLSLRKEVVELKSKITENEDILDRKKLNLSSVKREFENLAQSSMQEEYSLFPKKIDTNIIAKILELYSVQYSLISPNSTFTLNSISFSEDSDENATKTRMNVSIVCNKTSLKDFIYFIQNNDLPLSLKNAQKSSNSILKNDIPSINFLKENKLPIANIYSISFSEFTDNKTNKNSPDSPLTRTADNLMNNTLEITFFSQKEIVENTEYNDF